MEERSERAHQKKKNNFTHTHTLTHWDMRFFPSAEPQHNSAAFISPHRAMMHFYSEAAERSRSCTTDTFSHCVCMSCGDGNVLTRTPSASPCSQRKESTKVPVDTGKVTVLHTHLRAIPSVFLMQNKGNASNIDKIQFLQDFFRIIFAFVCLLSNVI